MSASTKLSGTLGGEALPLSGTKTSQDLEDSIHSHTPSSLSGGSSELSPSARDIDHHGHDDGTSDNSDLHDRSDTSEAFDDSMSEFSFDSSLLQSSLSPSSGSPMNSSQGPNVARIQQHRKMRAKKFVRKGQVKVEEPPFSLGEAGRRARPRSYFERNNKEIAFSIANELHCFLVYLKHLWAIIDEDRLPWFRDFLDIRKMRRPRSAKEVKSRLNLNIPYYAANYLQLFYCMTLPFLLFYNTPFLIVLVVTCVSIHAVSMRRKEINCYDSSVVILDHRIGYHTLGHVFLLCMLMLFMFFNGLQTVVLVSLLNASVIVPHALLRRTTFFDDEEMEKCRPKLGQYALTLLFLVLCYLEGADTEEARDAPSTRVTHANTTAARSAGHDRDSRVGGAVGSRKPSPSPPTLVVSKLSHSVASGASTASLVTVHSQSASATSPPSAGPVAHTKVDEPLTKYGTTHKEQQRQDRLGKASVKR